MYKALIVGTWFATGLTTNEIRKITEQNTGKTLYVGWKMSNNCSNSDLKLAEIGREYDYLSEPKVEKWRECSQVS